MSEQRPARREQNDEPERHAAPGDEKGPALRRRGRRSGAGSDTPAGPQTDRTVTPAKREQEQQDPSDLTDPR